MHPFASRPGRSGHGSPAAHRGSRKSAQFVRLLRRQAYESAHLEAERLLYVACTRAKHQLHLTATVGLRVDPDWFGEPIEPAAEDADDTRVTGTHDADEAKPWSPFKGSLLRGALADAKRELRCARVGRGSGAR